MWDEWDPVFFSDEHPRYVDLPARFTAQRHPGLPGYGELIVNATTLQCA